MYLEIFVYQNVRFSAIESRYGIRFNSSTHTLELQIIH